MVGLTLMANQYEQGGRGCSGETAALLSRKGEAQEVGRCRKLRPPKSPQRGTSDELMDPEASSKFQS